MKTHFVDVNEELNSSRSSWKLKLIVRVVFKYNNNDKKVESDTLINCINDQTHMLEIYLDVCANESIK